jgi:hypothetical protein
MLLSFLFSLLLAFSLPVKKVELELQVEPSLGLVEIVLKYPSLSLNLSLDKELKSNLKLNFFIVVKLLSAMRVAQQL